jgi:hypothetical protein
MPAELRFPLYSLADAATEKTIFTGAKNDRRLLLFTTAERANRYGATLECTASIVRLKEPSDLRILLASQGDEPAFNIEIDAGP